MEGALDAVDDFVRPVLQLQPRNEQNTPTACCQLANAQPIAFPRRPTVVPPLSVRFNDQSSIRIDEVDPRISDDHLAHGQGQPPLPKRPQ